MLSRQEFFSRTRYGSCSTEQLYSAYEAYSTCPAIRKHGEFQCLRCGSCCRRHWRVESSVYDIQRWIREGRLDIVGSLDYGPKRGPPPGLTACETKSLEMMCSELMELDDEVISTLAFTLAASREGAIVVPKKEGSCIFYDGSGCTIYGTRPEVCARFPDASLFEGLSARLE